MVLCHDAGRPDGRRPPRVSTYVMTQSIDYTRRSYERRAASYDEDRLSTELQRLWHAHDIEALDELLPRDGRILEVACGTGRITIPLAATGRALVGMELAGAMLRRAVDDRIVLAAGITFIDAIGRATGQPRPPTFGEMRGYHVTHNRFGQLVERP